jgi:hypothetical protein
MAFRSGRTLASARPRVDAREGVLRPADMKGCRDLQSESVWQGRRHRSTHERKYVEPDPPFAAAGRGACCRQDRLARN